MPKTPLGSWACLVPLPLLSVTRAVWHTLMGDHAGEKVALLAQLPRFGPKSPLFNFTLKRPGFAVVETRAGSPGIHRVLADAPVVSGRVPLPPVLSA